MTLYLDTSALTKLVVAEAESNSLRAWLSEADSHLVTSVIGSIELHRCAARVSQAAVSTATLLLARIDILDLTAAVVVVASTLPPPQVRTLDALHIASAGALADLEALVTYDGRMQAAAQNYGLAVESPGAAPGAASQQA